MLTAKCQYDKSLLLSANIDNILSTMEIIRQHDPEKKNRDNSLIFKLKLKILYTNLIQAGTMMKPLKGIKCFLICCSYKTPGTSKHSGVIKLPSSPQVTDNLLQMFVSYCVSYVFHGGRSVVSWFSVTQNWNKPEENINQASKNQSITNRYPRSLLRQEGIVEDQ